MTLRCVQAVRTFTSSQWSSKKSGTTWLAWHQKFVVLEWTFFTRAVSQLCALTHGWDRLRGSALPVGSPSYEVRWDGNWNGPKKLRGGH